MLLLFLDARGLRAIFAKYFNILEDPYVNSEEGQRLGAYCISHFVRKVSHACLAVTMYAMLAQHLPHYIHQPASTYLPCQSQRTSVSLAACSHAVLAYYASMAGDGIIHLASSMTRSELPEDLALPQKLCCSLPNTGMWKSSHTYRSDPGVR